jgi:hypothetical protein
MRYQQDLQVLLRERLRSLLTAHWEDFEHQLTLVKNWIKSQPALMAILAAAERVEPNLNYEEWTALFKQQELDWPNETEEGRATLVWTLMQELTEKPDRLQWRSLLMIFHHKLSDATREMAERLFVPLFDFLSERIGQDSNILYILERYARRIEWFDRDALFEQFQDHKQRGEEIYDRDLRKFLFSEGINMPFTQAKSASGLSDVVSELDTEDPLVCEVKLFDADNHGKREVAAGLHQVTHYAQDYGKTSAYLVIINLSGRPLELPSDGEPGVWPRFIDLSGIRTYLIPVRALPPVSASKLGKATPVRFSHDDLVNPDID